MKEAFELIKERLEEESQYSCSHCMERAISIVSEVEAEYGNGWIPCSERLPETDKRVLCLHEHGFIDCGDYMGEEWYCDMDEYTVERDKVVAWMPLPTPYKEDDHAKKN